MSRLLQLHVCSTKVYRGLETHHRSQPLQQTCQEYQIQNGNSKNGLGVPPTKRLVHSLRLKDPYFQMESERKLVSHNRQQISEDSAISRSSYRSNLVADRRESLSRDTPDIPNTRDPNVLRCLPTWGAHLTELEVAGNWSPEETSQHINCLELKAVWLRLQHFRKFLTDKVVVSM